MKIVAIIPARYASTRLPGKPLADICGKPMIQHVYERAIEARIFDRVVIATDDEKIEKIATAFGAEVAMTSPECASGTHRLCEAAREIKAEIYVNIQGDEPLIRPEDLKKLAKTMLEDSNIPVGTLYAPMSLHEARDPNNVKVVMTHDLWAIYFSRALIPYPRNPENTQYWGHMGVYAYRRDILDRFFSLPPSPLEETEKLEQLRLLQAGIPLKCVRAAYRSTGVDTEKDLERARDILSGKAGNVKNFEDILGNIKLIITDVDGVLTDGTLIYGSSGEEYKCFNAKDGLGISLAQKAGIKVAVLTGRDCPALHARLRDLGITIFRTGCLEKKEACKQLMVEAGVTPETTLFIGDDITDIDAFECCAGGVAPADAINKVKKKAKLITEVTGGKGVIREVIDGILTKNEF